MRHLLMHWSTAESVPIGCQPAHFPFFIFIFIFFFGSLVILCIAPRAIPSCTFPLASTHTNPLSTPRPLPTFTSCFLFASLLLTLITVAMIMVQKPVHLLSSPSTYHRRHPSAPPVVHVQPTHIPGLLSLSKPHPVTPPRSQNQHQNNNRQSRSSHNRPKPTNSAARPSHQTSAAAVAQPPLSEDVNKLSTPGRPTTKLHPFPVTSTITPDRPPRGRQSSKQSKDKSKPR
jgi:hypothetical protein